MNQLLRAGIRISKTEGSTTRSYFHDNGSIVFTMDGSTLSTANVLDDTGSLIGSYRGSVYNIYLEDAQGSTCSIVKQDGSLSAAYTYSDFGETEEITGGSFDNEICYTGVGCSIGNVSQVNSNVAISSIRVWTVCHHGGINLSVLQMLV